MEDSYFEFKRHIESKEIGDVSTKSQNGSNLSLTYSTCSNGHSGTSSSSKVNKFHKTPNTKIFNSASEESFYSNEMSYPISPHDLNLDALTENRTIADCVDISKSNFHENNNKTNSFQYDTKYNYDFCKDNCTEYIPTKKMVKFNRNHTKDCKCCSKDSNDEIFNISTLGKMKDPDGLTVTITDESETSISSQSFENTEKFSENSKDEINACNKRCSKRNLFPDENRCLKENKQIVNCSKKTFNLVDDENNCCKRKEASTCEYRNHQNTESFVRLEKYCENSENFKPRRSSCSEFEITENYDGDNEHSSEVSAFKTLDDTYISKYSIDPTSHESIKRPIYRSKSCDSLLQQAKHLPHILYDRFLKSLATEIRNMRKQKAYCTCHTTFKKSPHKDHLGKKIKNNVKKPSPKILNYEHVKENKVPFKMNICMESTVCQDVSKNVYHHATESPEAVRISSQPKSLFSPGVLEKSSSYKNTEVLISNSPNKMSTTPTQKPTLYWQKEITSPIGEYMRGKRGSPYKNSPSKIKL